MKVALVTGSAGGIGRAAAEALHADGCRVVIADINTSAAQATADEIDGTGQSAMAVEMDVRSTGSVDRAIDVTVERFGRLDVLVNNAGTVKPEPSHELTDESWSELLSVHLDGTMRCCRAAYPALSQAPGAAIVSVSSIAARFGIPKRLSYSAAKGGIEALTHVLAVEWAPQGIRVNAVAPGYVMTKRMEGTIASGLLKEEEVTRLIPMKRFATPEELGKGIAFLSSDAASYITGQVLCIDGGVSVNSHW